MVTTSHCCSIRRRPVGVRTHSIVIDPNPARLAKTLEGHEGLEAANANLMGQVTLAWDDERTSREAILAALARGGFRELEIA